MTYTSVEKEDKTTNVVVLIVRQNRCLAERTKKKKILRGKTSSGYNSEEKHHPVITKTTGAFSSQIRSAADFDNRRSDPKRFKQKQWRNHSSYRRRKFVLCSLLRKISNFFKGSVKHARISFFKTAL